MEEERKKPIHGIRIRSLNTVMIVLSCVLYVLLITATVRVSGRYDSMIEATDDLILCEQNAALVTEGSDYLTAQVRLYTVTAQQQYMDNYFSEVYTARRREQALEHLEDRADEEAKACLRAALENSNQLMEREIYAMRLIAQAQGYDLAQLHEDVQAVSLTAEDLSLSPREMEARARELTFGSDYQTAKAHIMADIDRFLERIMEDTQREQQESVQVLAKTMRQQQILISVLFIESIITFILIIVLIVKPLQVYIECIRADKRLEITGAYEFRYLALTYNDIYELNAANEMMLRHRAEHDSLTGLMNRGGFDQLKELLKAKAAPMALLIIDVDKFKLINDGYGHEMGDGVLKKVAALLEKSFRATDCPARVGGDEFSVILTDCTRDQEPVILAKVNAINTTLMSPDDGLPQVSLSVGGAFSPAGYSDDLYRKADRALYRVKENGRCGCAFFHEEAGGEEEQPVPKKEEVEER